MDDLGPFCAPGAGEKVGCPDVPSANRVYSFGCRDGSIKSLEGDPGRTLATRVGAPDSNSSERGEGEGDRKCQLAPSLTDRRRGRPTKIRIRGDVRQSANSRPSRLHSKAVT